MNSTGVDKSSFLSLSATVPLIIAMATIMILDLFGNTLVLCVLYRQRRRRNQRVANILIASLSLIDILMGLLLIPFSIAVALYGQGVLDNFTCQVNGLMNIFVGSASIWTLAMISVDRYRAIVSLPGDRLQPHHAWSLLSAVWFISLAIAIAPVILFGKYEPNENGTSCRSNSLSYILLVSVTNFLFPLMTMSFCYIKVFLKVRKQRIQMQPWKPSSSNIKTELKTAKIVFTVLTVFVICWLPFVVVYIISSSAGKGADISPAIFLLTGCLAAAHSVCNPVIYFTMNKTFRSDLVLLLPCLQRFHSALGTRVTNDSAQHNGREIHLAEDRSLQS